MKSVKNVDIFFKENNYTFTENKTIKCLGTTMTENDIQQKKIYMIILHYFMILNH